MASAAVPVGSHSFDVKSVGHGSLTCEPSDPRPSDFMSTSEETHPPRRLLCRPKQQLAVDGG